MNVNIISFWKSFHFFSLQFVKGSSILTPRNLLWTSLDSSIFDRPEIFVVDELEFFDFWLASLCNWKARESLEAVIQYTVVVFLTLWWSGPLSIVISCFSSMASFQSSTNCPLDNQLHFPITNTEHNLLSLELQHISVNFNFLGENCENPTSVYFTNGGADVGLKMGSISTSLDFFIKKQIITISLIVSSTYC